MGAAPVRPHAQALLDPEHQDVALDPHPILGTAGIAVKLRDVPVRGHDDTLGIGIAGKDLPAASESLDGRLHVDGLDVDEVLGQGHEEPPRERSRSSINRVA